MSHIIKSDKDIENVDKQLILLQERGFNAEVLEEILKGFIPKNDRFQVETYIDDFCDEVAFFPEYKRIQISPTYLQNYIFRLIDSIGDKNCNFNQDELFRYYVIFVLAHEVEHVYQYLIGYNYIDYPYNLVKEIYGNLIFLDKKINSIHRQLLVNKINKASLVFERNANVEAYDLLCKLAEYENNLSIKRFFDNQLSYYLKLGYTQHCNGTVEQTYNELLLMFLYKSLPKGENIPVDIRLRYGLPVDKEIRKKLLKK